jgi:hypothetical protein
MASRVATESQASARMADYSQSIRTGLEADAITTALIDNLHCLRASCRSSRRATTGTWLSHTAVTSMAQFHCQNQVGWLNVWSARALQEGSFELADVRPCMCSGPSGFPCKWVTANPETPGGKLSRDHGDGEGLPHPQTRLSKPGLPGAADPIDPSGGEQQNPHGLWRAQRPAGWQATEQALRMRPVKSAWWHSGMLRAHHSVSLTRWITF